MRVQKGPFTAEISTKFHSLIRSSPSLDDDGAFLLDSHGTSSRRLKMQGTSREIPGSMFRTARFVFTAVAECFRQHWLPR